MIILKRSFCNDREFIEKRDFCIISLDTLLDYVEVIENDEEIDLFFGNVFTKPEECLEVRNKLEY